MSASDEQWTDADILKRFPGHHLLTLEERDPDVKAFMVRHSPKDNPSLVRADFNGNGNLIDVTSKLATDEQCVAFLEKVRWPNGVRCPICVGTRSAACNGRTPARTSG